MLRASRNLRKSLGYSFSPIKSSTSHCLNLLRCVGRGDIWRQQWELLENRVYNKPNGCSATGALAPGPDHQQQQQHHMFQCCIPAVSRWRMYHRYCSLMEAEFELWLRFGYELLTLTITRVQNICSLLWSSNKLTRERGTQAVSNRSR
jgi:hypothetical protein